MPYFDGATGRVYYRHWTLPKPRASVVFLHGFGEHSGLYHRFAAALAAREIDLWALDEVGHGLSEGARGNFGTLTDLVSNASTLVDLARTESPEVPVVLAGHSLGSVVATLLALDGAERFAGLVISGAPLSPLPWLEELGQSADDAGADGRLELDPTDLSSDPFYLDELENDPLAFTGADIGTLLQSAFPPAWERFAAELPLLALPALAVHGGNDQVAPLVGVTAWQERIPSLRLHVVAGAGHDILNEVAHREVASTIADFTLDVASRDRDSVAPR